MKFQSKQIISVLLLLLIVISNSGFAIFQHMCKMDAETKCTATNEMSCCMSMPIEADVKQETLMNEGCCETDFKFIKFDFKANLEKYQTHIKSLETHLSDLYTQLHIINKSNYLAFYFAEKPLPKPGRFILQTSQRLLI